MFNKFNLSINCLKEDLLLEKWMKNQSHMNLSPILLSKKKVCMMILLPLIFSKHMIFVGCFKKSKKVIVLLIKQIS
jgi:hypothetical protein